MTAVTLKANLRETTGKGPARTLRRAGFVPAIIYGKGQKEVMISVPQKEVQHLQTRFTFHSTPVTVELDGKKLNLLPKSALLHPVTDQVEHVDFIYLDAAETVNVKVPLLFTGRDKSIALKRGGVLNIVQRSLEVAVSPKNIPSVIEVDITNVGIGVPVRLKDVKIPAGCVCKIKDLTSTVAKVTGKKVKNEDGEAAATEEK